MNPQNDDFDNRSATSPALFNRCVIDWFGEWSAAALFQVGHEFTRLLDLGDKEDPARAAANAKKAAASASSKERKVIDTNDDDEDSGPPMHMGEGKGTQREAVVSSLVFVHQSVHQTMQQVARQHGGRAAYVTPRHYLDFIKQYSTLFGEKRAQLEEQQRHLNNGLRKLRETQDQVARLGEELKKKEVELTTTKRLADDKLQQIMVDQKETEKQQEVSRGIAEEIKIQDEKINKSKSEAQARLALAEPNLKKAQESVGNIPREDLQFVSRLATPPVAIQTTLAACLTMMGMSS
jgi:dynein heavy chain 1